MAIRLAGLAQIRRMFLRTSAVLSLLALSGALQMASMEIVLALAGGFAVGTCDNCIMLMGIESSAKKPSGQALAGMKKNMLKRVAFVSLAFLLAIKAQANMLAFFAPYVLMHLVCLVVFVIKAREGEEYPERRKE